MAYFLPCTLDDWPREDRDAWIRQFEELARNRKNSVDHLQIRQWLRRAPYGAINLIQRHHSPLFTAVDQPTTTLLRLLIDAGARHSPAPPGELTVFEYCSGFWSETDPAKSILPYVKLLLEAGMPVDEVRRSRPDHASLPGGDGHGTPLKEAVTRGERALFDYLLEQGANPAHRDSHGFSVLDHCIRYKRPWWFLDLENHSALSPSDRDPNRLLVVAAQSGSAQVLEILLDRVVEISPVAIDAAEQSLLSLQAATFPPGWDAGPALRNAQAVLARLHQAQLDGKTSSAPRRRSHARL